MDEEKNLFLRKLRNWIGYGLGWRFVDALWDWSSPVIIASLFTILFLWFVSHLKVIWIP